MNIHEYQSKDLLSGYGVSVQRGLVVDDASKALSVAQDLVEKTGARRFVIKAQIHAGGRGKGKIKETGSRGVVLAGDISEVEEKVSGILGGTLVTHQTGSEGKRVQKVLIAEDVYDGLCEEYYVAFLLDRAKGQWVLMVSREGGMDIEEVAQNHPEKIIKEWISPAIGFRGYQARRVAFALGLSGVSLKEMTVFLMGLYRAYIGLDASMIEINPVLKTSSGKILAVDSKVILDDNALSAHRELRDVSEEDPLEVEASKEGLNYVRLDGNVGCMVNGAGLAMATMDIIKLSGGNPANFLDVGGSASRETVEAGIRILLKDKNVKAILINIFGGIVRCDRVAQGVVDAYENIGDILIPIVVRLQGTNTDKGMKIIRDSGLKVSPVVLLHEAASSVKAILQN